MSHEKPNGIAIPNTKENLETMKDMSPEMKKSLKKLDQMSPEMKKSLKKLDDQRDAIVNNLKKLEDKYADVEPIIFNKVEEEIDDSDVVFVNRKMLIREAKKLKLPLSEFFQFGSGKTSMRFAMDWDTVIRLINARMVKGTKITENHTIERAVDLLGKVMDKSFL